MFIYNFVILLYGVIIKLASIKNPKAKLWASGRKNWQNYYTQKIADLKTDKIIWIHCASYGEYEQGRPLIESIKNIHPHYKIVLTFFSPSGYEEVKTWKGAEIIGYLPLDTRKNANEFLSIVKPQAAIFIKYEFWLNFLFELKQQNIKTYLVSAVFKTHHPFFKWYGSIFRKSLETFNILFIQDHRSAELLESIGIKNYKVSGDTRFDRVIEIREQFTPLPFIEKFCGTSKVIIAGSTYKEDHEVLIDALPVLNNKDVKLILVPHEVTESGIQQLILLLNKKQISFSLYSKQKPGGEQVLIVDSFGLLSKLYYYCDVAYIGGGFGNGIHNCLEAAVYLKPVIFAGNTHHKYNEAVELLNMKVAGNILNTDDAIKEFNYFLDNSDNEALQHTLQNYFNENSGTTQKVLSALNLN